MGLTGGEASLVGVKEGGGLVREAGDATSKGGLLCAGAVGGPGVAVPGTGTGPSFADQALHSASTEFGATLPTTIEATMPATAGAIASWPMRSVATPAVTVVMSMLTDDRMRWR